MIKQCPRCACVAEIEATYPCECEDPETMLSWPSETTEYWCPCCDEAFEDEGC